MRLLVMTLLMVVLTACEQTHHSSNTAARVANQVKEETVSTWRELFTFRPTKPLQAPQTRYCYKMQSDIVCYDTPQPEINSKLVGYQDGQLVSYIQKGGGSLGISGAQSQIISPAVAAGSLNAAPYSDVSSNDLAAYPPPAQKPTNCTPDNSPFACSESQYIPNAKVGR